MLEQADIFMKMHAETVLRMFWLVLFQKLQDTVELSIIIKEIADTKQQEYLQGGDN
jgi:hypothetical protein